MTNSEFLCKNIDESKFICIKELLNENEYRNIKNKIKLIKNHFDKIDINMLIYRKYIITDDIVELIYSEKLNKELLKKTYENTNKYILDKRSPLIFDINIILGESQELLFLLSNLNVQINPNSKHNTRTIKSSYDSDFILKNSFIEFQSTINPNTNKIIIKKDKFNGLKSIYKNKDCYILQQKIFNDKIKYKIINIKDVEIIDEIQRFGFKKEYILKDNTDWLDIKDIKIGG